MTTQKLGQYRRSGRPVGEQALLGEGTILSACILLAVRFALGVLSYAATTPGGLFAPMLVLGTDIGLIVGLVGAYISPEHAPEAAGLALIGMAAFFTATVRAPVTGLILASELTGSVVMLPPMLGGIESVGYIHDRRSQRAAKALGEDIGTLLPGVHRVASLVKRWLLSTHQGAVDASHLAGYLDEFCFRFNRRNSHSRGLLFLRVLKFAVGHDPVRYGQLVARSRPKKARPAPPENRGQPPSRDRPHATRPWRRT